jgi:TPR repeat protein
MSCCNKNICNGCDYANKLREEEENQRNKCPFCRHPMPTSRKEADLNHMKRIAANDPMALLAAGGNLYSKGKYKGSFEYFRKAAELGNVDAHLQLSVFYREGKGVEQDEKKEIYHLEEAAIASHVRARYNLGLLEWKNNKRYERAVKHFIIAAHLGHDISIKVLKELYKAGVVSKEDFAAALRAHQAAVDATKSPQREAAERAEAAAGKIPLDMMIQFND